jgi:hypothetical protein
MVIIIINVITQIMLLSLTRNRNSVRVKRRDFEDKIRHDLCLLNIIRK